MGFDPAQAWAAYLASQAGQGGQYTSSNPPVYFGQKSYTGVWTGAPGRFDPRDAETYTEKQDNILSANDAQAWLRTAFATQDADWQRVKATVERIAGHPVDPDQVFQVWDQAVVNSALAYNGSKGAKLTPEAYLAKWEAAASASKGFDTQTSTTRSTNYTSAADAAGAFQQQAQQDLGRRASKGEVGGATAAVRAAEAANPSVTTSTSTKKGIDTQPSQTTTGGIGAAGLGDILHQQAMSAQDYAEYQAAGPIFGWLQAALNATSSAGQ